MNEKQRLSGVYLIRNTVTGKVYVGSSVNIKERWYRHRLYLGKGEHHCPHLQMAWKAYGESAFTFEVLELIGGVAAMLVREQALIDEYRAADRAFGYNVCVVVGSRAGVPLPSETRAKISRSNMGRVMPEEVRRKIALTNTGKKHSQESRAKMSASKRSVKRSQPHSIETRAKLSVAHMGKVLSMEHCKKLSEAHMGKQSTPESRAKASAALKGRSKSPETRARMALAQQKRFAKTLGSQL